MNNLNLYPHILANRVHGIYENSIMNSHVVHAFEKLRVWQEARAWVKSILSVL